MKKLIRPLMLAMSACLLFVGCSSNEPTNFTGNASQEEIDNYNALIQQAENEMKGDGEVEELKEEE